MGDSGLYSKIECRIIKAQIERRAKLRKEFLKIRTDPSKHAAEAGYVFDEGIQRFMSMKATAFEYFPANPRTITFGILSICPMFAFGYLLHTTRSEKERKIRCGLIPYRDRTLKFA